MPRAVEVLHRTASDPGLVRPMHSEGRAPLRGGSAPFTSSSEARQGFKRKRLPRRAAPRSFSISSDEGELERSKAFPTASGDLCSSEAEEVQPKRRAAGRNAARRPRTRRYGRWVSRKARPEAAQPTPLRTWRQRLQRQAPNVSDTSADSLDDALAKPLRVRRPALGPRVSPSPGRRREPMFSRSPHSRRLRRHESPVKAHASPRQRSRRTQYTGLERHFRGVGLTPRPSAPEGPSESDDVWDDASDLSSLSDVSSISGAASSEAAIDRAPSTTSPPGRPHRMRTRSVSQPDDADPPSSPPREGEHGASAPRAPRADELFTQHALLRRRRPSLLELCAARRIDVPSESTKATLVDLLLASQIPTTTAEGTGQAVPAPQAVPDPAHQPEPAPPAGVEELNGLDLERLELVDREIPPEKLEKLEKIGSGAFKDVYVGRYHISRTHITKVAISDLRNQLTDMDIKELKFLRDLRHENIVRFIGISVPIHPQPVPCMIVSELCSNGDLFDYIRNTPPPPDADIFQILLEVARGLDYLHTRSPMVIHRDCKSTNVLITKDRVAKISDFGFARVKRSNRAMVRSIVGTVNWQAPELWVPKPNYNEKVDVWSAAMTFWEALQWHNPEKRYPFQGMNEHQIYHNVGHKQQRPFAGSMRRRFGDEIVELLDRMWAQLPRERPSMSQVCEELERCIAMKRGTAHAA